jgi:hypothetical protein
VAGARPRNAGKNPSVWPFCQPGLAALYADARACDPSTKAQAGCRVPAALRVWNGNGTCVKHARCGGGYCHDTLLE